MQLCLSSKQVCFFHYSNELLLTYFSISITVSFINHFLEFIIVHSLSKFSCHSFEVFEGNFTSAIVIKKPESLDDLFAWISFWNFTSHKFHEVGKFNNTLSFSVNFINHLFDFLLFRFKAKSSHSNLQFFWVNVADSLSIKEIEGLFDLLFLLFSEFVSGFPGGLERSFFLFECGHFSNLNINNWIYIQ